MCRNSSKANGKPEAIENCAIVCGGSRLITMCDDSSSAPFKVSSFAFFVGNAVAVMNKFERIFRPKIARVIFSVYGEEWRILHSICILLNWCCTPTHSLTHMHTAVNVLKSTAWRSDWIIYKEPNILNTHTHSVHSLLLSNVFYRKMLLLEF